MTDIEKLKQAFEKLIEDDGVDGTIHDDDIANLFWPFVEYALNDKRESIQKIEMLNQLKHDLGMPLMAHELMGVKK